MLDRPDKAAVAVIRSCFITGHCQSKHKADLANVTDPSDIADRMDRSCTVYPSPMCIHRDLQIPKGLEPIGAL